MDEDFRRFRVIAESVPLPVAYLDRELRHSWVNGAYERWLGRAAPSVVGRPVRELLGATAWEALEPRLRDALGGDVVSFERAIPHAAGTPRWARVTFTPDAPTSGAPAVCGFVVSIEDLAEHEATEARLSAMTAELHAGVEELHTFFQGMPIGLFIGHDPACSEITMNAAGAALLGVAPGSNPSKTGPVAAALPFRALRDGVEVPPEDLPMQRAARLDRPVLGDDLEIVRGDGSRVDLWLFATPLHDAHGRVRGALGAFVETTARKRAEAVLRASETEYRALFELASVGAAEADATTGRLLKVNDRFCEITGYAEGELLARTFSDLTHPDDRERDLAAWHAAMAAGRGFQTEKRYVRSDGRVVWVLVTGRAVTRSDGRRRSFAHILDITDRRNAEARDAFLVRLDDATRALDDPPDRSADPDAITRLRSRSPRSRAPRIGGARSWRASTCTCRSRSTRPSWSRRSGA